MNNCTLEFSTNTTTIFFLEDQLYSHLALFYFWHSLAGVFLQVNRKYVLLWFYQVYFSFIIWYFFSKFFEFLSSSTMDPLKEGELELIIIWLEFYFIKKILSKYVLHICLILCFALVKYHVWVQVWDLYQQAAIMGKRIYFHEEVFGTSLQGWKYNVLVLDAGSNFRYFDFFVECPTDLQAVHEMALYL